MPKKITEYRVFVASPGDVQEERSILEEVIKEINLVFSKQKNIKLELVKWETHTYPDFGDDGQNIINKQLNNEYDIFIGIMHSRFGSPTQRFESGTYEEFIGAYEKWKVNPKSVSIMLYFKTSPVDIYKSDLDQLRKVKNFHAELIEKGGLIKSFETTQQFAELLRLNINFLLHDLTKNDTTIEENLLMKPSLTDLSNDNENEEVGFYESIDLTEQFMLESVKPLGQMTFYLNELGNKIESKTEKFTRLSGAPQEVKVRETRRLADLLADDYFDYCRRIDTELPIYKEKFSASMKYLSNANNIYLNWLNTQDSGLITSCESLKKTLLETIEKMNGFTSATNDLPGLTTKMIKAKKEIIKSQNKIVNELNFSIQLLEEILQGNSYWHKSSTAGERLDDK